MTTPLASREPCEGMAGFLFGHHFRARYDTTATFPSVSLEQFTTAHLEALKNRTSTYRCDICERCGRVVLPEVMPGTTEGRNR